MTLRHYGRHTGIHYTLIGRLESGKTSGLGPENLAKLAQAMGTTVETLRERAGLPQPASESGDERRWSVPEAVDADPNLTAWQRAALMAVYETFVPCGSESSR